jgi:hypothetical protein
VDEKEVVSTRSPAATLVVERLLGFIPSRAIYVAAKLGVADLLASGPRSADELAALCGAHGPSLQRVLRTLAAVGIFTQVEPGRFALNEPADVLRADVPESLRDLVIYYGEVAYPVWEEALFSVRTGKRAADRVFGTSVWEYFEQTPEASTTFNGAMRQGAHARAAALGRYEWGGTETVVDVGGGNGTLLVDLLQAQPGLLGIVVDRAQVVAEARARIADAGLEERCSAEAGDIFGEVPASGDVYVLAIVLHDWDDEHAGAILRNVRAAMRAGTILLLVEAVVPEDGTSTLGTLTDLHMLVELGGRERTEPEWRALLERNGFRLARILPLEPWSVLEAVPASVKPVQAV